MRSIAYIDAAIEALASAEPGTQEAREIHLIRRELLRAKARLVTMQRREAA